MGKKRRGHIEARPNGTFRAIVSAGIDPITGRRRVIKRSAPDEDAAEVLLTELLHLVDQGKIDQGSLTVMQVIDKHRAVVDPKQKRRTKVRRDQLIRDYVEPRFGGAFKASDLKAETLENYYALLQTCKHNAVLGVTHKDHRCEPLANSSIRAIHFTLTTAFKRAVRWEYLTVNQPALAEPPEFEAGNPDPPTPEELAPLLNEAWGDLVWGMFLWLTMLSSSRRGEMCVLRWTDIDWKRSKLFVERAGDQYDGQVEEITTKRKRRKFVGLDEFTMELLTMYREHCEKQCANLGVQLAPDAFLFSTQPDFSEPLKPNTATQRYRRLAKRNGLRSTRLHSIRHYSATELLAAGVDLRTVQNRLGHSQGSTTLKFYAAWLERTDQAAAEILANTIPHPDFAARKPRHAWELLAATLRADIESGKYPLGTDLPVARDLAAKHNVSVGTVSRATKELNSLGLVESRPYRRARVILPNQMLAAAPRR